MIDGYEEVQENNVEEIDENNSAEEAQAEVEVSLNAVVGGEGLNTVKLPGWINKKGIVVLVDSGSTHSFVDPMIIHQLNLPTETTSTLNVTVANGEQLQCDQICRNLQWEIQGEKFMKDCRVLKLGGCDIVLGMDWIDLYAPIELHTRPLSISFHKEGKKVNLKGLNGRNKLKPASKREVKLWKASGVKGVLVICEGRSAKEVQGELSVISGSQALPLEV